MRRGRESHRTRKVQAGTHPTGSGPAVGISGGLITDDHFTSQRLSVREHAQMTQRD
jgi:hypothetical protein